MAESRVTEVIRYFKAEEDGFGAPIPGTEDKDIWIDVETIVGFVTEQGTGVDFKRKFWTLDQKSTARTYEWKRVYKDRDNDPDAWVPVPLPGKAWFESGTGKDYKRFSITFDNATSNVARDAVTYRVFQSEFGSNGLVDVDRDSFIDVEVLDTYVEDSGVGIDYKRDFWFPYNLEIPVWDPKLKRYEYKVQEKPSGGTASDNPLVVWPSHREPAEKPKPEVIK